MFTSNLEVVDMPYIEENAKYLSKDWSKRYAGDYYADNECNILMDIELNNDQELKGYLSRAREAVKFMETGNKGGRFDYDLCLTGKCWGGNSNTVQRAIYDRMGIELDIPKEYKMPGIDGRFYNGPMDDVLKRSNKEKQQENKS